MLPLPSTLSCNITTRPARISRSGFTLVELSIVLVIIGLLVGGILVGTNLISAAAIRMQISQIEEYSTSANTFRIKYGALPGDLKNFDANAFGFATRGTARGQGNGDDLIEGRISMSPFYGSNVACGETGLFWRDLSAAKLIAGSFTTASYDYGVAPCNASIIGNDINKYFPKAKLGDNAYVYAWSGGWRAGQGSTKTDYKNYFSVSSVLDPYVGNLNVSLTPNQAYAIDSKIDDGFPQSGNVLALYPSDSNNCFWAAGGDLSGGWQPEYGASFDWAWPCGPTAENIGKWGFSISVDPQDDYDNDKLDCYDNRNVLNDDMQYSTQFMGGNNIACALSIKFQ